MEVIKTNLKRTKEERALAVLFTTKQINILKKVLALEKLTVVENVSYSRAVKPKLNAIIDLYEIAIAGRSKD
jgi:hypothetical protein